MSKKILLILIAVIVMAVLAVILLSNRNPGQEGQEEQNQQEEVENTPENLDATIISMIEQLKPTCKGFLEGELSGEADCPGFDRPFNRNVCYYCFAVKNQDPSLCTKIDYPGLRPVCEKATGSSIDQIIDR